MQTYVEDIIAQVDKFRETPEPAPAGNEYLKRYLDAEERARRLGFDLEEKNMVIEDLQNQQRGLKSAYDDLEHQLEEMTMQMSEQRDELTQQNMGKEKELSQQLERTKQELEQEIARLKLQLSESREREKLSKKDVDDRGATADKLSKELDEIKRGKFIRFGAENRFRKS